jgi:hypothetical protein
MVDEWVTVWGPSWGEEEKRSKNERENDAHTSIIKVFLWAWAVWALSWREAKKGAEPAHSLLLTAEPWRVNLSTPQSFSPRDFID